VRHRRNARSSQEEDHSGAEASRPVPPSTPPGTGVWEAALRQAERDDGEDEQHAPVHADPDPGDRAQNERRLHTAHPCSNRHPADSRPPRPPDRLTAAPPRTVGRPEPTDPDTHGSTTGRRVVITRSFRPRAARIPPTSSTPSG
jgi:hypothetical protein